MSGATNLYDALRHCIEASDPAEKIERVNVLAADFEAMDRSDDGAGVSVERPGRPALPKLVSPRDLPQRGLGSVDGRAALLHAVTHIEFNAINLALDAAYRFRAMPPQFVADWISVAVDEARHFSLLSARLEELGHRYGSFDAHDGLWAMAERTAGSVLARMALVPRVLEARGLDVTPGMIKRLRALGD
ncbi:MAG: ferritin-like domain-containing protein, partial [Gammaproteobacteria bacterium]|nr:ferritin-like domain-containing protein [Gammaproteobacteria bacterium]